DFQLDPVRLHRWSHEPCLHLSAICVASVVDDSLARTTALEICVADRCNHRIGNYFKAYRAYYDFYSHPVEYNDTRRTQGEMEVGRAAQMAGCRLCTRWDYSTPSTIDLLEIHDGLLGVQRGEQ